MIFGIGPGEFLGLAVLAIFFVGPERLPKFSSDAAKFLKKAKTKPSVLAKKWMLLGKSS
jgi:Sec-independent protein translocase protein TatA